MVLILGSSTKCCEKVFAQHGKEVTNLFLKGRRFGSLKVREGQVTGAYAWNIIHPAIRALAQSRFEATHYADAVEAAYKELNDKVKKAYKAKLGEEPDGADLMRKAFSTNKNNNFTPVFPIADNATETGRNEQEGYMNMLTGAMIGIRNPKAHNNLVISAVDAWEKIVMASHFMKKWDQTAQ